MFTVLTLYRVFHFMLTKLKYVPLLSLLKDKKTRQTLSCPKCHKKDNFLDTFQIFLSRNITNAKRLLKSV